MATETPIDTPAFVFQPRKPIRYRARAAQVAEPTPPPPTPVTILSVALAGSAIVIVQFSGAGPIEVDTGVTPDAGFTIGDGGSVVPITVSPLDATRVTLELSGEPADGWPWQLGAQPNWLITPAVVPQYGAVTA